MHSEVTGHGRLRFDALAVYREMVAKAGLALASTALRNGQAHCA
ncbi:MAG: hypothetical protein ACXWUP_04955 [Allosphingosinicella sp.]